MLTLRDAVRIEEYLKRSFHDVIINGSREEPVVRAKNWKHLPPPMPCQHVQHTIARNIYAYIGPTGHLGRAPSEAEPIMYDEVVFCTRCEHVFKAVAHKDIQ